MPVKQKKKDHFMLYYIIVVDHSLAMLLKGHPVLILLSLCFFFLVKNDQSLYMIILPLILYNVEKESIMKAVQSFKKVGHLLYLRKAIRK